MTMAFVILVLAWSIADVCSDLDTRGFLVATLSEGLDPRLLPAIIFTLAALTAFATGTSWGTMGILIPLAVPTAYGLAEASTLGAGTATGILLASVSSVLAGAIFGDHCSPISDTTVLSSTASGCDHVDHVRTQLPYALAVAAVGMLLGYLPAGYGVSPFLCLPLGAGVLAGGLWWLGREAALDGPDKVG
jgi:Na+/H+ antiporter NhaC